MNNANEIILSFETRLGIGVRTSSDEKHNSEGLVIDVKQLRSIFWRLLRQKHVTCIRSVLYIGHVL